MDAAARLTLTGGTRPDIAVTRTLADERPGDTVVEGPSLGAVRLTALPGIDSRPVRRTDHDAKNEPAVGATTEDQGTVHAKACGGGDEAHAAAPVGVHNPSHAPAVVG